jgi:hypothetical protein
MPPRLKPRTAPKNAAVKMVLYVEPPLPRAKMKAVYEPATVQKASRKYMTAHLLGDSLTKYYSIEILLRVRYTLEEASSSEGLSDADESIDSTRAVGTCPFIRC